MPCFVALFALFVPRLMIALIVIFSDYIGDGFKGTPAYPLIPLLGFIFMPLIFMPLTTLAYAWAINANGSVDGVYLVAVIVAGLIDLGILGGGARAKKTQYRVVKVRRKG
jgi:hypothetical protein